MLSFSIVTLKFADLKLSRVLTSTPDNSKFPILINFTLLPSVYSFIFIQSSLEKSILKLLQETCRKNGVTVVIITHNLALTPMGDKVIEVKNGRIKNITINKNPVPVERIEW